MPDRQAGHPDRHRPPDRDRDRDHGASTGVSQSPGTSEPATHESTTNVPGAETAVQAVSTGLATEPVQDSQAQQIETLLDAYANGQVSRSIALVTLTELGLSTDAANDRLDHIAVHDQATRGPQRGPVATGAGAPGAGGTTGSTQLAGTPPVPAAGLPASSSFVNSYNAAQYVHGMWQQLYNGLSAGAKVSFSAHKSVAAIEYIDTKGPH